MAKNPNRAGLGLNLGLTGKGRGGFRTAVEGGNLTGFLDTHKRAGKRFARAFEGEGNDYLDPARADRANAFVQQSNAVSNAGANQPVGIGAPVPGAHGSLGLTVAPNATPPPAAPVPPAPAPTFWEMLNQQLGVGNPFSDIEFADFDTLANAIQANSDRGLGKNLALLRERMGSQGMGTSTREALMEGEATAANQAQVDAMLAQLSSAAREGDLNRAAGILQLITGAQQGNQQTALTALQGLANIGIDLSKIGGGDQPRFLDAILPLILNLATTNQTGWTRQG
jgi:hypothetical protein